MYIPIIDYNSTTFTDGLITALKSDAGFAGISNIGPKYEDIITYLIENIENVFNTSANISTKEKERNWPYARIWHPENDNSIETESTSTFLDLYKIMQEVSIKVYNSFNTYYNAPPDTVHLGKDQFAAIRYESNNSKNLGPWDGNYRMYEHRDLTALALVNIIFPKSHSGKFSELQVLTKDFTWTDIPYIPGVLILIAGEVIQRWTNDEVIAMPHRVCNTMPNKIRHVVCHFSNPKNETVISNLTKNKSIYKDVTAKEFSIDRLEDNVTYIPDKEEINNFENGQALYDHEYFQVESNKMEDSNFKIYAKDATL